MMCSVDAVLRFNGRWSEWAVWRWDRLSLNVVANLDLTYHHEVEVTFSNVEYAPVPAPSGTRRSGSRLLGNAPMLQRCSRRTPLRRWSGGMRRRPTQAVPSSWRAVRYRSK